jgi:DNA-binding NarL/FixJ family response regulator
LVDIVIIDTEPLIRQLVADLAEAAGLRVLGVAASAAEAQTHIARADKSAPAALVIAIRPAGSRSGRLDGPVVVAELRQRLSGEDDRCRPLSLGVVYIAEHTSALGRDALSAGEQFLTEPFGSTALARAVYGVIGQEVPRWLSSRVRANPVMRA